MLVAYKVDTIEELPVLALEDNFAYQIPPHYRCAFKAVNSIACRLYDRVWIRSLGESIFLGTYK
jgi:hypothetical protein